MNKDELNYIENRSDPLKSADRYDEIIQLRLFLYEMQDLLEDSEDQAAIEVRRRIFVRASRWGKKGDIV